MESSPHFVETMSVRLARSFFHRLSMKRLERIVSPFERPYWIGRTTIEKHSASDGFSVVACDQKYGVKNATGPLKFPVLRNRVQL